MTNDHIFDNYSIDFSHSLAWVDARDSQPRAARLAESTKNHVENTQTSPRSPCWSTACRTGDHETRTGDACTPRGVPLLPLSPAISGTQGP